MEPTCAALLSADSTKVAYRSWVPQQTPVSVMVFVHGIGGHSGQPTYRYFVDALVHANVAVYGIDLRGHGNSDGIRGHVNRWVEFLDDVSALMHKVRKDHPHLPVFVFGQSLGGLIALEFAIERGPALAGVIASAPALAVPNVRPWLPLMTRVLSRIAPRKSVRPNIDIAAFTRDPEEVVRLRADPLSNIVATTRMGAEFQLAMARVHNSAPRLKQPFLMMFGDADSVTPIHGAESFFRNAGAADKTCNVYPGGYHQPILDTNRDEVLADLLRWIAERTVRSPR